MFQSEGIIKSSNQDPTQKPDWYYLAIDQDFTEYYNSFIKKGSISSGIYSPRNGPHITFIAGEKEELEIKTLIADSFLGNTIPFLYDNTVYTDGRSFWMDIQCPELDSIRIACGLEKRKFPYHLTLGNIKNAKI